MSLKVLLADDNITAQRLGTKILTEAGYEVIAVSNGAAAVKKIAAEKPDLLILDVYMPGYTGLEVCEKVKQDAASSTVPVILTATNMEPYNQADGHRVGADGFMVKPFEASDLVAVVQKFASRIAKSDSKEAEGQHTIKMAAVQDFSDASYEEWKTESEEPPAHKVEVPQEMAAAPALGMEDYGAPAAGFSQPVPAFGIEHAQAMSPDEMPTAAIELPVEETTAPSFLVDHAPAAEAVSSHLDFLHAQAPPESAPALDLASAMGHDVSAAPPAEFEPTSVPAAEVAVTAASELEPTAIESPQIADTTDPGLVTNADEISQFATGFGVAHPEEIPVGIAMPEVTAAPEHHDTQKIETYAEAAEAPASEVTHEAEAAIESEMQRAFAVSSSGAAVAPAPMTEPEPEPHPSNASIPQELVQQFAAELDQAHQEREARGEVTHTEEAQSIEASMEAAPEIPASQLDEEKIAAAVNRALEKYKDGLRAELIATIVRELKG